MHAQRAHSEIRSVTAAPQTAAWGPDAYRVLDHGGGPLRVLGGPGTGKTTLVAHTVADRVLRGVDPAIACTASVTEAPTSPPARETASSAPQSRECMGTASVGSISMTGSGDIVIGPEGTSFSCETGPHVSITRIDNTAVTFTAAGAPVTIAKGSSATVGPYQITVLSIDAGTAVFKVVAPS